MGFFDRLASQVVGGVPDKVTADLEALGRTRAQEGNDEGAVVAFGQAVDRDAMAMDAWLGLGEALARLGRREPAEEALRRVLGGARDDDQRARAHAARGRMAMGAGQPGRAVRELRRAVDLVPEDATVMAQLGRALHAQGEPEGAAWLERAALLDTSWILEAADAQSDFRVATDLLKRGLTEATPAMRDTLQAALSLKQLEADGQWEAAFDAGLRLVAGAQTPTPFLLRLLLGSLRQGQDPRALIDRLPEGDDRISVRRAFDGYADETTVLRLMQVAPTSAARTQLASWGAPGPAPTGQILGLLGYARDLALRAPELKSLLPTAAEAVAAFDRPLVVAVMGEFNAGKSSFVNALIGADVAPVGITPTTATINVFSYGLPGARVRYHDGRIEDIGFAELRDFLARADESKAAAIRTVEIFSEAEVLRRMQIVDTPGWNAILPAHESVARAFMTDADALVWIFAAGQAGKATEQNALQFAQAAGKRVLGIVNKVDEIDAGDLDVVMQAVRRATGDVVELLLPLSTRPLAEDSLAAVQAAIETRFFLEARRLKQQTALQSLRRFVQDAQKIEETGQEPTGDNDRHRFEARAAAYAGAMARARIALPARIGADLHRAADELRMGLRPRDLLPDPNARAVDEAWWSEVFEDVLQDAVDDAAAALIATVGPDDVRVIEIQVAAFLAFVRGLLAGGLAARSLVEDFPLVGRPERSAFASAFSARAPSALIEFLEPVDHAMNAVFSNQRRIWDQAEAEREARRLLRDERLRKPIESLRRVIEGFECL